MGGIAYRWPVLCSLLFAFLGVRRTEAEIQMGLDIHAVSHLRYVRPIPQGEEFDRLEEEVNRQGKVKFRE